MGQIENKNQEGRLKPNRRTSYINLNRLNTPIKRQIFRAKYLNIKSSSAS